MTDLVLRAADLTAVPMPPLCARTGRPARGVAKLSVVHVPRSALAGLPLGVAGVLFLAHTGKRQVTVRLPVAPGVKERRTAAAAGALVLAFLLILLGAMLTETRAPSLVLTVAVLAALLAGCARTYLTAWVGGSWVDEETVRLTRLHPSFAAALTEGVQRLSGAGWHPDPGGTAAERWFDGRVWTKDLRPLPAEAPVAAAGYGYFG